MSNQYKPFWDVTQNALVFASRKLGLNLDHTAQVALMGQYEKLQVFPENLGVLQQLSNMGVKTAILSNGTSEMLDKAVEAGGFKDHLNHVLSVDAVKKYKTATEAYLIGPDTLNVTARDILFVSSNCWDVCGASWFGYTTFWVNRAGAPMEELGVTPDGQGSNLTHVLEFVRQSQAS